MMDDIKVGDKIMNSQGRVAIVQDVIDSIVQTDKGFEHVAEVHKLYKTFNWRGEEIWCTIPED